MVSPSVRESTIRQVHGSTNQKSRAGTLAIGTVEKITGDSLGWGGSVRRLETFGLGLVLLAGQEGFLGAPAGGGEGGVPAGATDGIGG